MKTRDNLAALDDHCIIRMKNGKIERIEHAGNMGTPDVLALAEKIGLTHIWIMPGTEVSTSCSDPQPELEGWNAVAGWLHPEKKDAVNYVSARRDNKRHEDRIQICIPEWSVSWPTKELKTGKQLLAMISYAEDAIGQLLEWTPASTVLSYFKEQNRDRWSWLSRCGWDFDEGLSKEERNGATREFDAWKTCVLQDGRIAIKIDKNSAHPAACSGLRVGEGNPKEVTHEAFNGLRPGFWRVRVANAAGWDGKILPDLRELNCMTTDMINQARKAGLEIDIRNGICWEKYHQVLRTTVEQLWKLRMVWRDQQEVSPAHSATYALISSMITSLPGKLGDSDQKHEKFRRRDIWAQVLGRSTSSMIYNIETIRQRTKRTPIAINKDALFYIVDSEDELNFMLDADRLGGYKKEGKEMSVSQEFVDIIKDTNVRPNKLFKLFKDEKA